MTVVLIVMLSHTLGIRAGIRNLYSVTQGNDMDERLARQLPDDPSFRPGLARVRGPFSPDAAARSQPARGASCNAWRRFSRTSRSGWNLAAHTDALIPSWLYGSRGTLVATPKLIVFPLRQAIA